MTILLNKEVSDLLFPDIDPDLKQQVLDYIELLYSEGCKLITFDWQFNQIHVPPSFVLVVTDLVEQSSPENQDMLHSWLSKLSKKTDCITDKGIYKTTVRLQLNKQGQCNAEVTKMMTYYNTEEAKSFSSLPRPISER